MSGAAFGLCGKERGEAPQQGEKCVMQLLVTVVHYVAPESSPTPQKEEHSPPHLPS